jgi:hypothetical protein
MATGPALDQDARQTAVLDGLLSERVPGRFAVFFETGEGDFMPDGVEEMTGYVMDATGAVFWFELGWDGSRGAPVLTAFERATADPSWDGLNEYREARESLGLPNP